MAPTGWFRTEGGSILEMDLPLPEPIAQRVARGEIQRVANADGGTWVDPETADPDAVSEAGALAAELDDTRADLDLVTRQRDALAAELQEARAELDKMRTATPPAPAVKATKATPAGKE